MAYYLFATHTFHPIVGRLFLRRCFDDSRRFCGQNNELAPKHLGSPFELLREFFYRNISKIILELNKVDFVGLQIRYFLYVELHYIRSLTLVTILIELEMTARSDDLVNCLYDARRYRNALDKFSLSLVILSPKKCGARRDGMFTSGTWFLLLGIVLGSALESTKTK
ncbi:hypothetical protein [Sulfuricurvum sp.]|uniref:hypothetical protein n=1 Tax=Sulfuricurvum sp. TaxID=2025608 RepID=UPI0035617D11